MFHYLSKLTSLLRFWRTINSFPCLSSEHTEGSDGDENVSFILISTTHVDGSGLWADRPLAWLLNQPDFPKQAQTQWVDPLPTSRTKGILAVGR